MAAFEAASATLQPSSLVAVKLEKCQHQGGRSEIRVVNHGFIIEEIFGELHGRPIDGIEAKCAVSRTKVKR